jgi:hypothetical protein
VDIFVPGVSRGVHISQFHYTWRFCSDMTSMPGRDFLLFSTSRRIFPVLITIFFLSWGLAQFISLRFVLLWNALCLSGSETFV